MRTSSSRGRAVLCSGVMLAALTACSDIVGGGDCVDVGWPAISVRVVDQRTGATITSGTTLVASDGDYADSTSVRSDVPIERAGLAIGRPGRYALTVRKPGYRDRTLTDIRAPRQPCGVTTQYVTLQLEPVAP